MKPRQALYIVWLYGVTVLLLVLYLPLLLIPRQALREGQKAWARLMIWGLGAIGGVRVEIRGRENLPQGSFLIAAKHQSMFDIVPPFVFASDVLFVMKTELFRIPLFGAYSRKAGMIEVDRSAHAQALRRMVADAKTRMAEPRQLLIFPEGTRQPPGAAVDYKPGVAALYRELDLPCAPVATNSGVCLDSLGHVRKAGTVVIEILPAIPPGLKRAEFMRLLQERIEPASQALLNG